MAAGILAGGVACGHFIQGWEGDMAQGRRSSGWGSSLWTGDLRAGKMSVKEISRVETLGALKKRLNGP